MFDAHPTSSDLVVVYLLGGRQLFATRLLCRLEDLHALEGEPLKAHVLQQLAPRWQGIGRHISHALSVDAARSGRTQEHDAQRGIDEEEVFQHMPLFLAAITRLLFNRVCGARNGSLGAVMTKRGAAAGVAGSTADAAASKGRSASASPRWWRKASTLRHGASPKVCKAFRNTGSRT